MSKTIDDALLCTMTQQSSHACVSGIASIKLITLLGIKNDTQSIISLNMSMLGQSIISLITCIMYHQVRARHVCVQFSLLLSARLNSPPNHL